MFDAIVRIGRVFLPLEAGVESNSRVSIDDYLASNMSEATKRPLVSIIIPNLNARDLLRGCLNSLLSGNYVNYEIIVVDGGSTDGSIELVQREFPNVKLVLTKIIGVGEKNNVGFQVARGEIIVFSFDNDHVASKAWLFPLVDMLSTSPEIGVVSPKRLRMDDGKRIYSLGSKVNWWTGESKSITTEPPNGCPVEADFVAPMAVRRETVERIGLFDPNYVIYYEDTDFCIRARKSGYRVVAIPSSIVWHLGLSPKKVAKTVPMGDLRRYYYARRNQIRFIIKFSPMRFLVPAITYVIAIKTIIELIEALPATRWLLGRFSPHALPYFEVKTGLPFLRVQFGAIAWSIRHFGESVQERMKVTERQRRGNSNDEGMQKPRATAKSRR